jgi:putative redox protein
MSSISKVTATQQRTPYLVALHNDLGHAWSADEPQELGGGNAAPEPTRLLLPSLGACTAITLRMVAARRQWPLADARGELELKPSGQPASGNDIVRRIHLEGDLSAEQRAQLKEADACPMQKLLTSKIRITSTIK